MVDIQGLYNLGNVNGDTLNVPQDSPYTKEAIWNYILMNNPEIANITDPRKSTVDNNFYSQNGYFYGNEGQAKWHGAYAKKMYQRLARMYNPETNPDVVMDIDETIFSNANNQAKLGKRAKELKNFNAALDESHRLNQSVELVPGVLDFMNAVKRRGGNIHLVTGRKNTDENRANLEANLRAMGVPFDTLEFSGYGKDKNGKKITKQPIFNNWNPQMSIGDSLGDNAEGSTYFPLMQGQYGKPLSPQEYRDRVNEGFRQLIAREAALGPWGIGVEE